jgi:hypothetical protein
VSPVKRSNFLLLPIVAVVTVVLLGGVSEIAARLLFREHLTDFCQAGSGPEFKPNCVSSMKAAEGPDTTVEYNACGYRSAQPCEPKPASTIRVAVLGSSISRGYAVAYADTYAARSESALSRACGRPVDFQNISMSWPASPTDPIRANIRERTDAALRLNPDLLLLFVSSWDLFKYNSDEMALGAPTVVNGWRNSTLFRVLSSITRFSRNMRENSRAVLMIRHVLYLDDKLFVESYLRNDDAGYLLTPFSFKWSARLSMLDRIVDEVTRLASAANVRIAVVFVPFEPQVLLARSAAEPGIDPHAFDRAIGDIAARHGARFIDTLPRFVTTHIPEQTYYRVNGHPNSRGHSIIAEAIVRNLTEEQAFNICKLAF